MAQIRFQFFFQFDTMGGGTPAFGFLPPLKYVTFNIKLIPWNKGIPPPPPAPAVLRIGGSGRAVGLRRGGEGVPFGLMAYQFFLEFE